MCRDKRQCLGDLPDPRAEAAVAQEPDAIQTDTLRGKRHITQLNHRISAQLNEIDC
jgi:hypothetical protein